MSKRITIRLIQLVIILIMFESIIPAFTVGDGLESAAKSFRTKHQHGSPFAALMFEKAEKEERSEEERDKFLSFELLDFQRISTLLARVHDSPVHFIIYEAKGDPGPSLHKLFCIYLI